MEISGLFIMKITAIISGCLAIVITIFSVFEYLILKDKLYKKNLKGLKGKLIETLLLMVFSECTVVFILSIFNYTIFATPGSFDILLFYGMLGIFLVCVGNWLSD